MKELGPVGGACAGTPPRSAYVCVIPLANTRAAAILYFQSEISREMPLQRSEKSEKNSEKISDT